MAQMAICKVCGTEFKDSHPAKKINKFCCREHWLKHLREKGSWNKGKKWKEMYNEETYNKLQKRITSTGEKHHLYGVRRPDLVVRNLLNNPMHSESRRQKIKEMLDDGVNAEIIYDMVKRINVNKKFQYQRKAYKFYGEVCTICGATKDEIQIDVHHVDKNRKNNKIENLRVWCASCHGLHHKNPDALPQTL